MCPSREGKELVGLRACPDKNSVLGMGSLRTEGAPLASYTKGLILNISRLCVILWCKLGGKSRFTQVTQGKGGGTYFKRE